MTTPNQSAAAWLLSVGPILERFRAEDRALAELHSAHVEKYYDTVEES